MASGKSTKASPNPVWGPNNHAWILADGSVVSAYPHRHKQVAHELFMLGEMGTTDNHDPYYAMFGKGAIRVSELDFELQHLTEEKIRRIQKYLKDNIKSIRKFETMSVDDVNTPNYIPGIYVHEFLAVRKPSEVLAMGRPQRVRNPSKMSWVYHSTNPKAAQQIIRTKTLTPKAEPSVYVSNVPQTAYGKAVVRMQVPSELLVLDDEFPDGRMDYRIDVGYGGKLRVKSPSLVKANPVGVEDDEGWFWITPNGEDVELDDFGHAEWVEQHVPEVTEEDIEAIDEYEALGAIRVANYSNFEVHLLDDHILRRIQDHIGRVWNKTMLRSKGRLGLVHIATAGGGYISVPVSDLLQAKSAKHLLRRRNPDEADLSMYLGPKGTVPTIGPEKGRAVANGIARFTSPFGSVRYVAYKGGVPVSVLQVVTRDGKSATTSNLYTVASHRRRGIARKLLARARKDFESVKHTRHLTRAGAAWTRKVNPCKGRKPNPGWGGFIRGEYWIHSTGDIEGADIDVGDKGHEAIAINRMLDMEELLTGMARYYRSKEVIDDGWSKEEAEERAAELEGYLGDDEMEPSELVLGVESYIPDKVGAKAAGSRAKWKDVKQDARVAYAKHKGAIQVVDTNFYAWKVTRSTIDRIIDFLHEMLDGEDGEDGVIEAKDRRVHIEEGSTNKHASPTVSELLTIKNPRDLWALRRSNPRKAKDTKQTEPSYLPLSEVTRWKGEAARQGVSKVARSNRGFLSAYKEAGSAASLPDDWNRRRRAFLARHMAQVKARSEPLFDADGLPTRRHLALIMWAYSPDPAKLRAAARRGGNRKRKVNPAPVKVDRIAIDQLSRKIRNAYIRHVDKGEDFFILENVKFPAVGGEIKLDIQVEIIARRLIGISAAVVANRPGKPGQLPMHYWMQIKLIGPWIDNKVFLQEELERVLLHEATHVGRIRYIRHNKYQQLPPAPNEAQVAKYINDPEEVEARAQEISAAVLDAAKRYNTKRRHFSMTFDELLNTSQTWRAHKGYFTEANRRLIREKTARVLSDANLTPPGVRRPVYKRTHELLDTLTLAILEDAVYPKVSKSAQAFMTALRRSGFNFLEMPEEYMRQRDRILTAYQKKGWGKLWDSQGRPTRRHLELIAWAYTPDRDRLDQYVSEITSKGE